MNGSQKTAIALIALGLLAFIAGHDTLGSILVLFGILEIL